MSFLRYYEALRVWAWLEFQLPPELWHEAQAQLINTQNPPDVQTPALQVGLQQILDPKTTNQQKLLLLRQLLQIIKDGPQTS